MGGKGHTKPVGAKKVAKDKEEDERILCFGSMRGRFYGLKEARSFPGPFEHSTKMGLLKKLPNKSGYTLLASKNPRSKYEEAEGPPVGTYDVEYKRSRKQNTKPFGVGAKLDIEKKWITPAPGSHSFFKRTVKLCAAFGNGQRIYVPLVHIKCGQFNMSKCFKCKEQPIGDYWHKDSTNQDMCRPCMENEWKELKKCSTKILVRHRGKLELEMFHLMRYCGFYHEHNCTKAAVQFMPTKELNKKLRMENYLASYGL